VRRSAFPLLFAVLLAGAGCRERGRPDPSIRMVASHEVEPRASTGQGDEKGGPRVPTRLEVPPAVQQAYSGVRLSWKDASNGQEGVLEVPLGGTAKLPGSSLEVRGDVFLPAFSMSQDTITSSGVEEENPAARIAVAENGQEIFGGWVFTRFPDVHPFEHKRYPLKLVGGIRKAPSKK
jgi:hypothetical protein